MTLVVSTYPPVYRAARRPSRLAVYAGFVKLEHTVFSLPLILAGAWLHLRGRPSVKLLGLIFLAAMGARVMAMGLNRIIDAKLDARNPRTRRRELPRGAMRLWEAWVLVGLAGMLYLWAAASIAPICLALSPIPVALFAAYPYLKRLTSFAHLGLGLTWSLAPVGGWLAASKSLSNLSEVGWLWAFCVLWVTGFDVIYATLDEAFDREAGLHALPARLGARRALNVAATLHALAFLALLALWQTRLHTAPALVCLTGVAAVLIWQHLVAERNPAFAFFQLNGWLGLLVLAFVVTGT